MTACSEIKAYREKAGVSRAELGRRLGGLHRATVCKWESGERAPSAKFWPALMREIGIPLCKLAPSLAEAQKGAANVN